MSLRMRLMGGLMRPVMRLMMNRVERPEPLRWHLDVTARWVFRRVPGMEARELRYPEGRALWVRAGPVREDRVLLYIHGGGFIAGRPETHQKMVARLCLLTGMRAFMPAYRLAPEHPLPAAQEDIRRAWDYLRAEGYAPEQIIIGGDSAGGGLALSLLAELGGEGQRPAGVFAWSPCADLSFSGASVQSNDATEHFFPARRVHDLAAMALGDMAAEDPRVSPLFAEFSDCPPVLIQASESEILFDDARRMAEVLRQAGGAVELETWAGAPHVWQIFDGWFPEARAAIASTARWISSLSDR